jgi:adenylate cyclase class 2
VSGTPSQTETEIKLPSADLSDVRRRLEGTGGRPVSGRRFEHNTLFDDVDGRLQRSGRALRLRRSGGRVLLTLKGPARWSGGVREREELEVVVSDDGALSAILDRLGLEPRFRYEKWRECWRLEDSLVALDETPLGAFVEIEGPAPELPGAALRLGLDPASATRSSYPELWVEHRERHPELELPVDMVFDSR